MKTKYEDLNFNILTIHRDIKRLTNQLWKLIPMRENNENWKTQLTMVLIEMKGLQELFENRLNFLIIISQLEGLLNIECDFINYRRSIFNSIHLLNEVLPNE